MCREDLVGVDKPVSSTRSAAECPPHPVNGLDLEIQRWADVLTVDKLAVIRTGDHYRKMILAGRAANAAGIGLPGILCVGLQFGLTGLLVLVVLYGAGIATLIVMANVYGYRAGLPLYPLDWRVRRIMVRDRWNLTWWRPNDSQAVGRRRGHGTPVRRRVRQQRVGW